MKEIYKPIIGYEGYYEVSNMGNVKSLSRKRDNSIGVIRERILRLNYDSSGYRTVKLYKNGIKKTPKVHRLVCISFIDNPLLLEEINHIDGIKTNNHIDNLEWCTRQYNISHSILNGLVDIKGENGWKAKLKNADVLFIRSAFLNKTYSTKELMELYGVSNSTINHIKLRRTWKHI